MGDSQSVMLSRWMNSTGFQCATAEPSALRTAAAVKGSHQLPLTSRTASLITTSGFFSLVPAGQRGWLEWCRIGSGRKGSWAGRAELRTGEPGGEAAAVGEGRHRAGVAALAHGLLVGDVLADHGWCGGADRARLAGPGP